MFKTIAQEYSSTTINFYGRELWQLSVCELVHPQISGNKFFKLNIKF